MVIIVQGNTVNGFTFTGPFASFDEAIQYADWQLSGEEWHTAELAPVLVDKMEDAS